MVLPMHLLWLQTEDRSSVHYKRRSVKDTCSEEDEGRDSTMSICKTCSSTISWDQKKREALKIRGPCNPDGSVHQCMKKEQVTKVTADLDLKEQGLSKSIQELTSTINILISLMSASTEAERNYIKKELIVK
jgi:hypothetical protein